MSAFARGIPTTADEYRARKCRQDDERRSKGSQVVPHSFSQSGSLEFGDTVVLRHVATNAVLSNDIWTETGNQEYYVFGEKSDATKDESQALAKCTFVLVRACHRDSSTYDRKASRRLVYGEPIQLMCNPSLLVDETMGMLKPSLYLKSIAGKLGEPSRVCMTKSALDAGTHFVLLPDTCAHNSNPYSKEYTLSKGKGVRAFDQVCLKHCMSNLALTLLNSSPAKTGGSLFNALCTVAAKRPAQQTSAFAWRVETSEKPEDAVDSRDLPPRIIKPLELLKKIRELQSHRSDKIFGIRNLSRAFRLMDSSRDGKLSQEELLVGLQKSGVELDVEQCQSLFKYLDADNSGAIDLSEFLRALRGPLSKRRLKLVLKAYEVLDADGNGTVELKEIAGFYDTSWHPDVVDGRRSHEEVVREFISQWDNGGAQNQESAGVAGDGLITKEEFVHYYRDISAAIDDDDYFELMIRNAWHISGGRGQCQNSSNIRCLVRYLDDTEEVVELKGDFGVARNDMIAVREKLKEQGVKNIRRVSLAT